MRTCRTPRPLLVLLMIVSLAVSGRWASAANPFVRNRTRPDRVVRDVRLAPEGVLQVRVVDANGHPGRGETVHLRRNGISVAVETTDEEGAISIRGLQGGVYEIAMQGHLQMFRFWLPHLAPPAAMDSAFLVVDGPIVRGQRPLGSLVNRRSLILGALVVAAIAIPVAINNDDESGS